MYSSVRPASGMRHRPVAKETLQYGFKFNLNGAPDRLSLPADKAGAVEVQCGKEGPAHPAGNLAGAESLGKLRKCLS